MSDDLAPFEFVPQARCDVRHKDYRRAEQIIRYECLNCGAYLVMALCATCYQWAANGTLTCSECSTPGRPQDVIRQRLVI